jgi:hypothetical protein
MARKMYRTMDVNKLHREGRLQPGWAGALRWTSEGEEVGAINLRAEADGIHLTYRVRLGDGARIDVAEIVRIDRMPCRFGGARPYFICPGVANGVTCGRRVTMLYGPLPYFLCRHCCGLAHASHSGGAWDRKLRLAEKIRQRLGGDPDTAAPFPPKPKRMWRRTYERLREQALAAEMAGEEAFMSWIGRGLARIDNRKRTRKFWR